MREVRLINYSYYSLRKGKLIVKSINNNGVFDWGGPGAWYSGRYFVGFINGLYYKVLLSHKNYMKYYESDNPKKIKVEVLSKYSDFIIHGSNMWIKLTDLYNVYFEDEETKLFFPTDSDCLYELQPGDECLGYWNYNPYHYEETGHWRGVYSVPLNTKFTQYAYHTIYDNYSNPVINELRKLSEITKINYEEDISNKIGITN